MHPSDPIEEKSARAAREVAAAAKASRRARCKAAAAGAAVLALVLGLVGGLLVAKGRSTEGTHGPLTGGNYTTVTLSGAVSTWSYVGSFKDYTSGQRTMPASANQGGYGAACYPNAAACALPNPTTIAACQAWGAANGFNTVGIQYGGECYGCAGCNYAAQGAAACGNVLGCGSVSQVYQVAISSPPPPPPPPAAPPPLQAADVAGVWSYAGAFVDFTHGVRTLNLSANQRSYGATCAPNPSSCALSNPTSVAACQAWGASNGFDTIGLQARALCSLLGCCTL